MEHVDDNDDDGAATDEEEECVAGGAVIAVSPPIGAEAEAGLALALSIGVAALNKSAALASRVLVMETDNCRACARRTTSSAISNAQPVCVA